MGLGREAQAVRAAAVSTTSASLAGLALNGIIANSSWWLRVSPGQEVANRRQLSNGDHAGSEAASGNGDGRVTRPVTSTVHSFGRPPRAWRKNMITRPLGAQLGPSSR